MIQGTPVLIWGTVQVRNYEKDNERKWITEVIAENFQLLDKIKRKKEGEMDLHFDEIEKMEVVNK
ncbi:hypothetical protein DID78_06735 [Candidatus Marinamargulisbacteria bacterium SCGC AG-343-D04]|nr:hypothetical protein DID78_06735 [Candidatus Marinamargulisbacteria bacterium SCGC AG-343-D04]